MLEPVERSGDCGRRADLGLDDDEVLRRDRAATELRQECQQRLARIDAALAVREHVTEPAKRVARLHERELADVAGHGRLRPLTAGALEGVEQLLLRPEPHPLDEARDELLALGLRQLPFDPRLHGASIAHPTGG